MSQPVGRAVERVDGHLKVTGGARYAADRTLPGMLHGALVLSTIARGTVAAMDLTAARNAPGVVAVYNHENAPRLVPGNSGPAPMQNATVAVNGQIIGYVVAETEEQALDAASMITVTYGGQQPPKTLIADAPGEAILPPNQELVLGDPKAGLAKAEVTVTGRYSSPTHHHNAIEPHAVVAQWEGEKFTVHLSTQGVANSLRSLAAAVGVPVANGRVQCEYLGGGFGGKTSNAAGPYAQYTLAIARELRRPVKLVLTRAQLYSVIGQRAEYQAEVTLGATRDGALTAMLHFGTQQLSRSTGTLLYNPNRSVQRLYGVPNLHTRAQGVRLDLPTAAFMRAPEMCAHFAMETALDELSHELRLDPVELRLRNYTEIDPATGRRYSSKYLREAYQLARDAFGWQHRDPRPGKTKDGKEFIGWGMATEAHAYEGGVGSALVRVATDGTVLARSATQDIGTGTYTVMTQVTAQALGIPVAKVRFELGDTTFPTAGMSASSATVPSLTGAVDKAARAVRGTVIRLAVADPRSPLHGLPPEQITAEHGFLWHQSDRSRRDSYRDLLTRHGAAVEHLASGTNEPGNSTGAVFVEVRVDPRYGRVRVSRMVGAYDCGRVLNRHTARSQAIGGLAWGIGNALMEHTVYDRRTARVVNPNLSTYLLAVNADIPDPEILFVDKADPVSTALGARGFGECPITGVPAAIGNAIFHATGRRLRDLPFTQDKLL
ncbi:xanthine dehydrogenase family protein molybdopterin-binding subunit [Crossiella cryophila]|uniref:Xanthine dehydrogenase YagR molybdenum-binding subunit n=1 Tax=Crossiella cryophila TaxID=43355 RepID=A0A7W7FWQ7_9PSEU|nr:xanthine dehydrogenase family protein molybdopterin-binding subunit [Crossiella cryophila]MBB4679853.1 xanthine dehydrogenase YagR molybdenum-binding subunit [Crossiella cryophila]